MGELLATLWAVFLCGVLVFVLACMFTVLVGIFFGSYMWLKEQSKRKRV